MSFKSAITLVKKLALMPADLLVKTLENWDLEVNKISASILLAGIIAMVAGLVAGGLYGGAEHGGHKEEAKRGYTIPGAEQFASGGGGGAAPAAEEGPVDIAPFLAKADSAAGAGLVKRCTACHTFDKGGKNGVGPNNYGVVGNHVAHVSAFTYSDAMKNHKGKWGFQELSDFLANPKKIVPGTKMAFAGIKNPQERANLIAYINSQSDAPLPLPK